MTLPESPSSAAADLESHGPRQDSAPPSAPTALRERNVAADPRTADRPHLGHVRVFLIIGSLGSDTLAEDLARTGRIVVIGTSSDVLDGIADAVVVDAEVVLVDRFVGLADGLVIARRLRADGSDAAIVLRTPWPAADHHDARRSGLQAVVDIGASAGTLADALLAAAHPTAAPSTHREHRRT